MLVQIGSSRVGEDGAVEGHKVIYLGALSGCDVGSGDVGQVQGPSHGAAVCGGESVCISLSVRGRSCVVVGAMELVKDAGEFAPTLDPSSLAKAN